jgi:hypothetical protein
MEKSLSFLKKCPRCKEEKDINSFKASRLSDIASYCLPCTKQYNKEYRLKKADELRFKYKRFIDNSRSVF